MTRWNRRRWAGFVPNGIGRQKPNHYGDMVRTVWENHRHPLYAWRILSRGVCDGCALGVAGFHDWTIEGVHLCTTRLKLLSLNTADAMAPDALADAATLRSRTGAELRQLGRLGQPLRWRDGEAGYSPITWDDAVAVVGDGIAAAGGERTAMFLTSRGVTNETYYAAGKAARAMEVASVDSAARVCHSPSTVALKEAIGVAATTCSFADVLCSDLIVLIGSNPANNQPVFMKYLYEAVRNGARVVVVNPYLEPGLERYWIPSSPESALFGTKICDLHIPVRPGGDVAFCNAVLKTLVEEGGVDGVFVRERCEGWEALADALRAMDLGALCAAAGLSVAQVQEFAEFYRSSASAVFVWSMGITQHAESVDGVQAIVNLALARGNVERDGTGLMPIRGHSGVQGGAEMGAYATALPGGLAVTPASAAALAAAWGFDVPAAPGLTAPEMVEAAARGDLDVLWLAGGNFLEVLPDGRAVEVALGRVPLRVHQDLVASTQMLVPPAMGGQVIVLPARTRYEQEGGGTETTTERRIVFSPEIPGHRVGEARAEWRIFAEVAARARPSLADKFAWGDGGEIREEIARVVPLYAGIESLSQTGDSVQYGGRHLPLPWRRFRPVAPPAGPPVPEGSFVLTTRRGKQFNSMVWSDKDPLNGARREDVLIDPSDAAALGLAEGDAVVVASDVAEMPARIRFARLPARTVQAHFPEANVLIPAGPTHREPHSNIPAYTTVVRLRRA